MSQGFTGGCLCGAVHYQSSTAPEFVVHCHCVDCRKTSGTGHGTLVRVPEDALTVSGTVKFYDRPADSGNIMSRGFCPNCGSPLSTKNSGKPGVVFLRASSLDDPEIATPQLVVFTSRAPSWDYMDKALPAFPLMPDGSPRNVTAQTPKA